MVQMDIYIYIYSSGRKTLIKMLKVEPGGSLLALFTMETMWVNPISC